jgi:hypothetical protein
VRERRQGGQCGVRCGEARPGHPFIGVGLRWLGRASGDGNELLQCCHFQSEGGGRKCGRVKHGRGSATRLKRGLAGGSAP